jgi:hypothetical protein
MKSERGIGVSHLTMEFTNKPAADTQIIAESFGKRLLVLGCVENRGQTQVSAFTCPPSLPPYPPQAEKAGGYSLLFIRAHSCDSWLKLFFVPSCEVPQCKAP